MIQRILQWLTDATLAESIIGDLQEERARRSRASRGRATLWYWRTSAGLVVHAASVTLREGLVSTRAGVEPRALLAEMKQAARALMRTPVSTIVIVATLTLALGLNTAVFSLVHGVLFDPLPFPQADRLVFVEGTRRGEPPSVFGTSYPDFLDLAREQHSFETLATSCYWTFTVTGTDVPLRVVGQRVTGSFFPMLAMRPMHGRWIDGADDQANRPEVIVIAHGLWQRIFGGDPGAVGRRVMLNGRSAEIIGVMPAAFRFPFEDVELWAPMLGEMEGVPRNSRFFSTIGRLRASVSRLEAQREVEQLASTLEREHPATNRDWRPILTEALPALTGNARPRLMLLFGAVLLVLLVAAVNVAALLVSRTATRTRELNIRVALGAGRWRLGRVLLFESAWLGFAGLATGLLVAAPSMALLKDLSPRELPRVANVALSWPVAAWAALAMVTVIGAGALAPLLSLGRRAPAVAGGDRIAGPARNRAHRLLVSVQIAGAFALVVATGLLMRSFAHVLDVDPGFNPDRVVKFRVFLTPPTYRTIEQQIDFVTRALETLTLTPGIVSAASVTQPPFDAEGSGTTLATAVEGKGYAPGTHPVVAYRGVSAGYFQTMALPILEGRAISEDDRRGAPLVAVINRAMADRLWPGERALGRRFEFADGRNAGWITVVGIAGDVATDGLEVRESPAVYAPYVQRSLPFLRWMTFVARTSGDARQAINLVRARVQEIDAQQPIYSLDTMDATIARSVAERRFSLAMMGVFAGLTLVLATLGVYGMLAQRVASRSREIGVRLALGAVPRQVFRLVLREGTSLVIIGLVLGGVVVVLGAPLIESSLFGVTAADGTTFIGSITALTLAALLASLIPALSAARTDPVRTLRSD